jgi:hypothetical protein
VLFASSGLIKMRMLRPDAKGERHVGPSAVLIRSPHPAHVPGRLAVVVQTPDPLTKRISFNQPQICNLTIPSLCPMLGLTTVWGVYNNFILLVELVLILFAQ